MTRLYLSGPMTGLPDLNRPAFHAAAQALRARGYTVISPPEVDRTPIEQALSTQRGLLDYLPELPRDRREWCLWLRADIAQLVTCHALAYLPGWERSDGAHAEITVAKLLHMPITPVADLLGNEWRAAA